MEQFIVATFLELKKTWHAQKAGSRATAVLGLGVSTFAAGCLITELSELASSIVPDNWV